MFQVYLPVHNALRVGLFYTFSIWSYHKLGNKFKIENFFTNFFSALFPLSSKCAWINYNGFVFVSDHSYVLQCAAGNSSSALSDS